MLNSNQRKKGEEREKKTSDSHWLRIDRSSAVRIRICHTHTCKYMISHDFEFYCVSMASNPIFQHEQQSPSSSMKFCQAAHTSLQYTHTDALASLINVYWWWKHRVDVTKSVPFIFGFCLCFCCTTTNVELVSWPLWVNRQPLCYSKLWPK